MHLHSVARGGGILADAILTNQNLKVMFHSFYKSVGGRGGYRYFKDWERAKEEMEKDIQLCIGLGWSVTKRRDFFKADKGYYVYEAVGITDNGEMVSWSVLDHYFED